MGATISIGKARTAVLFKKPTRFFEELINKGRTAMTAVDGFTPLIGGIPIMIDGQVVGGIGVSGASSAAQDEELALAGANALMAVARRVEPGGTRVAARKALQLQPGRGQRPRLQWRHSSRTSRSLRHSLTGMPLLETGGYKVHASRGRSRVRPKSTLWTPT